ncbi:MAG: ATP-binding cassette domain-containing protein [Phormidium tanganyikae FI6-MK23]|jgi:ABC-2 type transport system ATP-binding protein|nr:ATP-binding cassette domain-containing protein [Phormidium tanganyikae FI6-MK23]
MTSALELTPNVSRGTTDSVIQVHQLHKHYGRVAAVRGIDFSVAPGELFGLIGPDGAGKTTTFHILGGIMEATAGEVQVLGLPARDARLQIGYLTQQFSLYLDLSINENLEYVAGLREVPDHLFQQRRRKYLKLMSLDQFDDRLAGQLSGGMKQKLALCCALVSQPKVLLLDEPTTGVDPVSRREFWDVLAALAAEEVTIVVATPYLDEAERCNRVALMYDGMIQQIGTPAQLRQSLGLHRLEVHTPQLEVAEQALNESSEIVDVQPFGDRLDVLVADPKLGEQEIRAKFRDRQLSLTSIQAAEPTLENVFVTRLRQQGSAPQVLEFPRSRSGRKSSEDIAIYAHSLNRMFGTFQAVKNVDVEVRYGEIFGLLGANGAGKTTTIKMLCGLLPASSGDIALGGERSNLRSRELRKRIGYMSQKFTLYDDLSIVQNLEFYTGVYGVPRRLRREKIDWVLATCGLEGQENMLTGQLPGGWKQRVAFGASVLHEPDILFLDEPTSGVDPLARRQFWRLINDFARNGTAILVTTHYLEEAEQCNRMSFMVAGETVLEGSPSQIKAAQPGQLIEVVLDQTQAASNLLKQQLESWRVSIFADRLHIVIDHPEEIEELRSRLTAAHLNPISLLPIPYSLEDAFIGVVQRAQIKS